jgi:tryptophanyl-tRNA synthetase
LLIYTHNADQNGETLRTNTYSTAAAYFGLDVNKVVFYRQSDVPQTAELSGI